MLVLLSAHRMSTSYCTFSRVFVLLYPMSYHSSNSTLSTLIYVHSANAAAHAAGAVRRPGGMASFGGAAAAAGEKRKFKLV